MPLRDLLRTHGLLYILGEFQEPDQVRDGGAVEAQAAGEFFLSPAVVDEVVAERDRLFQRVQVLALEVLDHGDLADLAVIEFQDSGREVVEPGLNARAEASLAGDELKPALDRADEDGL